MIQKLENKILNVNRKISGDFFYVRKRAENIILTFIKYKTGEIQLDLSI